MIADCWLKFNQQSPIGNQQFPVLSTRNQCHNTPIGASNSLMQTLSIDGQQARSADAEARGRAHRRAGRV
jgi:hypothetical protein